MISTEALYLKTVLELTPALPYILLDRKMAIEILDILTIETQNRLRPQRVYKTAWLNERSDSND